MLKIATRACFDAGQHALKHFRRPIRVKHKGKYDLVTNIDHQCEKIILEKIQRKYPSHTIDSEEKGRIEGDGDYTWIIDPLDGTINYARGIPYWGISIGILKNDEPYIGVVYDPLHNDMIYAQTGKGTFLNHKKVRVSKKSKMSDAIIATEFTTHKEYLNKQWRVDKKLTAPLMGMRITNSVALNMLGVACGRFDGYAKVNIRYDDFLMGDILVREAGGKVTDLKGKPFEKKSTSLLMSNGLLHSRLLSNLR